MRDALSFVMGLQWADVPEPVKARVKMALLDVIGVGAGGAGFRSAQIAAGFAADHLGGNAPLLFDDRHASAAGAALPLPCLSTRWMPTTGLTLPRGILALSIRLALALYEGYARGRFSDRLGCGL